MNLTNTHTHNCQERKGKKAQQSFPEFAEQGKKSGTRFCQGFKIYLDNGFYMGFNWNMVKVYKRNKCELSSGR